MKILVVDDDPTLRRLIARLASRHPGAIVREAEDGVAALAAIEADAPDLLFTDMQMPYLDGLGLLETLRNSVEHKELPVVAVSSVSEKSMVLRMVALGIDDYLLKPLDPATAGARFEAILANVAAKRVRTAPSPAGRTTLLLVDSEAGYGDVVRAAVGGRFEVVDDLPAAAALAWAVSERPTIALLGEGLPMPGERAIAAALRARGTTAILLAASAAEGQVAEYDAVVPRSYAPKRLAEALEAHLPKSADAASQLTLVLATDVGRELAAGCRQSVGILVGEESAEVAEVGELPDDRIVMQVLLAPPSAEQTIACRVFASRHDLAALAETGDGAHREPTALLAALTANVGARVAQALLQRGWAMAAGDPALLPEHAEPETVATSVEIVTESGHRIMATLHLLTGRESSEAKDNANDRSADAPQPEHPV